MLPWAAVSGSPVWFHDIDTGRGTEQLSCRGSLSLGILFPRKSASGVSTRGRAHGSRGVVCSTSRRPGQLPVCPATGGVNSDPVRGASAWLPTAELPCFLFVFNKLHVGRFSEISYHSQFYPLT